MKKKVIVTGGLGFIGSNLIELLLNKSYQVINIDKNTYSSNFYNVKEFKNNKNYSFIKCDIASPKLSKIIFKSNPIGIFNLAAETHVDRSIDRPKDFISSNILGTFNILEQIRIYKKKYKIGLSWKSFSDKFATDKSLNLKDLNKIFSLTNCDIFNLQYGVVEDEINSFNKNAKNKLLEIEGLDLFNDFEGIASLLKSLDVFVTISNSTAHLAGALGVKTILIKPENFAVFHYWNQKNNKTPWYSSVELVDKKSFFKNSNFLKNFLNL